MELKDLECVRRYLIHAEKYFIQRYGSGYPKRDELIAASSIITRWLSETVWDAYLEGRLVLKDDETTEAA